MRDFTHFPVFWYRETSNPDQYSLWLVGEHVADVFMLNFTFTLAILGSLNPLVKFAIPFENTIDDDNVLSEVKNIVQTALEEYYRKEESSESTDVLHSK